MIRIRTSWMLAGLLLVLLCVGGQCKPNPARPASLNHGETKAAWYSEFFADLGEKGQWTGAIFYTRQSPKGLVFDDSKAAAQVYKPVTQNNSMVLAILYNPEEHTDPPPMQLQLLVKKEKQGVLWGEYGDPVVICDLTLSQARQVLDDGGVPESLQTTMVHTAEAAGWVPKLPAPNEFGGILRVFSDDHFASESGEAPEVPED